MKIHLSKDSLPAVSSWPATGDFILAHKVHLLAVLGACVCVFVQQEHLKDPEFLKKFYTKAIETMTPYYRQAAEYLADGKFITGVLYTVATYIFYQALFGEMTQRVNLSRPEQSRQGIMSITDAIKGPSPSEFQEGQPIGLGNYINNCWLNSALQGVMGNPSLVEWFLQHPDPSFNLIKDTITTYKRETESKCLRSPSIDTQKIRIWMREQLVLEDFKDGFIGLVRKLKDQSPEVFFKEVFQWIRQCGEPKPNVMQLFVKYVTGYSASQPTFLELFNDFTTSFLARSPSSEEKEAFQSLVLTHEAKNFDDFFHHIFNWLESHELKNAFFKERRSELLFQTTDKQYAERGISIYGQEDPVVFFEKALRWSGYLKTISRTTEKTSTSTNTKKSHTQLEHLPFLALKIPDTRIKYYYENSKEPLKLEEEILSHFFAYRGESSTKYKDYFTQLKFSEIPQEFFINIDRNYQSNDQQSLRIENRGKIINPIDHPETIELTETQCPQRSTFTCDGFIVHKNDDSRSIDYGHYVSYVKRHGKWWKCNDSKVTEIPNDQIMALMQSAYFLHYSLVEEPAIPHSSSNSDISESSSVTTSPEISSLAFTSDSDNGSTTPPSPPSSPIIGVQANVDVTEPRRLPQSEGTSTGDSLKTESSLHS